ncbi:MAG TPA: beta galactosidase jelly roll domain-containing protein, partial [Solirubrobacteraceae bacterium]|nr:beta galactosidase jelly roll domain-containing protein [Solirubrobacteraceae bacterium]
MAPDAAPARMIPVAAAAATHMLVSARALTFAKTPLSLPRTRTLALGCAAFVAASAAALALLAARAGAPPLQPVIYEGEGGRVALTQWTLRKDPSDRGEALGWQRGGFSGASVSVPNVVDPAPYTGRAGARNCEGSVAWYRTSFDASRAGAYVLSFQSANYEASVWVDGHALGSHRGSYLPFEMRTQSLAAGEHTVVVRVDWRDPAQQAREGFHRTWFNWGGIDGDVDVRALGESELSSPTVQTTLAPDSDAAAQASVKVSVLVRNYGARRTLVPEGTLVHGAQTIPLSFTGVTLARGQAGTATASATVPEPAVWSPAHPSLYELSLSIGQESSYAARVGLRELTWHGGSAYLNGAQLKLHGVSIQEDAQGHGDALSAGDEDTLVDELKDVHANVVRSQHPLDAGLLERLDEAGILVWQGI